MVTNSIQPGSCISQTPSACPVYAPLHAFSAHLVFSGQVLNTDTTKQKKEQVTERQSASVHFLIFTTAPCNIGSSG